MNPDLSLKLLARYDYLFRDPETGKFNEVIEVGFACKDGWYNILDCLFEVLSSEVVALSNDEKRARKEIEKVKKFIHAPKLSESQVEKRASLLKKARKAELNGDAKSAKEYLLNLQILDDALQRLIDDELRRYKSLESALKKLELEISEAKVKAPKISQVKEKFGTLRVIGFIPEDKQAAVSMAEILSARTCEQCGAPGKRVIIGNLYATLCIPHANEKAQGRPMQIFGVDQP